MTPSASSKWQILLISLYEFFPTPFTSNVLQSTRTKKKNPHARMSQ